MWIWNSFFTNNKKANVYQIACPEPLKGELAGYWSVRIDEKNRIVFRVDGNNLEIMQCGTYYKDIEVVESHDVLNGGKSDQNIMALFFAKILI